MLAPEDFTVGTIGTAVPLSLILPRNSYEEIILIGHIDGAPAAVFLTGQCRFQCFLSTGNHNYGGLVIPGVRIEVDETSLFDAHGTSPLGVAVRTDTRLIVRGKSEDFYGSTKAITLHDNLTSAGENRVGFTKWQAVIGSGDQKRVLIEIDLTPTAEP
jgi:hypothetical protein